METRQELANRHREQTISVFKYLRELTQLRTKTIRDVDRFQEVFWFDDLPHADGCHTIAWNSADDDQADDVWLEIRRADEPKCPAPPSECRRWIDDKSTGDHTEPPNLAQRIRILPPPTSDDKSVEAASPPEPVFEALEDHAEVSEAWKTFVRQQWEPWATEHRNWSEVQECYASLFKIQQELHRLGEQFELVVGLGLLTWNAPASGVVRRHVLVANAALEFDATNGVFSVRASAAGARLAVEVDMLQPGDRPNVEQQEAVEKSIRDAAEDPWNRAVIVPALKAWGQSLSDRGSFEDALARQVEANDAPTINFAPALILRKRSGQSLLTALDKILEDLEDPDGPIPPEITRLVTDADDFADVFSSEHRDDERPGSTPEPTYFPLAANEEQIRIVETLRHRRGVLVQGPPGTGKSHTIANLICHLLATGKRVLITAQTPRALRVLQDKLPQEIGHLCVSLLGNDRIALQSLEDSVAEISNRYARWDAPKNVAEQEDLRKQLDYVRREEARLNGELQSLRESDSRRHEIVEGVYRGTAQHIAARLRLEKARFGWLNDEISQDDEVPFPSSTFGELRASLLHFSPSRISELEQTLPATSDLPTPDHVLRTVQKEEKVREVLKDYATAQERTAYDPLSRSSDENLRQLKNSLHSLSVAITNIDRRPLPWISDAIYAILTDDDTPWKALRRVTADRLSELEERAARIDAWSIIEPESVPKDQLLADAQDLKSHYDSGGGAGWGPFRAKIVKRTSYLAEDVRVNGRRCDNPDVLADFIDALELRRRVEHLWSTWEEHAERKPGPLLIQVSFFVEQLEALDAVLAIEPELTHAKESCSRIEGLGEPAWHDRTILTEFRHTVEAVLAERDLDATQKELSSYVEYLSGLAIAPRAHPLFDKIAGALRNRKVEAYGLAFAEVESLSEDRRRLEKRNQWLSELESRAPLLTQELLENPADDEWENRIKEITSAWDWARTSAWLEEYLRPGREQDLESEIGHVIDKIRKTVAKLAAVSSWGHFFSRLTENQRSHLMGWQQAIKKIGRGTGKHAPKHRRNAQEHLNKCRDAIPAWIMPLYRVFETIPPEPEIFDVVIIDEASQCGPDALVLLYLAKKVIIVGDNQQISPEAVGVNQDDVDYLIRKHLTGIDHADSFSVTSSLFDHGVIRYGNRIVLREHFRCMPEIIQFSNDLCYRSSPLIPLRQYPPARLKPVVTVHRKEGYREGSGERTINRPEAEAVVQAIIACSQDPQYEDKTFGVISLQGNGQARLIESMLLERMESTEISDRRIVCGNAYSFQGDERDVMFLSLVAAGPGRIGTFSKESDKRRFNVAASRARDQMWLIHSVSLDDLSSKCLRYELLRYCQNPISQRVTLEGLNLDELEQQARTARRRVGNQPAPFDSWFEVDVFLQIVRRGYRVIPQFRVAEYRIDLVVEGAGARLAVECDGDEFHGIEEFQRDMDRQRTLERCGWKFWRVRGGEYYRDPEQALDDLWQELDILGIRPQDDNACVGDTDGYRPDINFDAPFGGQDFSEEAGAGGPEQDVPDSATPADERTLVQRAEEPVDRVQIAPRLAGLHEQEPTEAEVGAKSDDGLDIREQQPPPRTQEPGEPSLDGRRPKTKDELLLAEFDAIKPETWVAILRWGVEAGTFVGQDRSMLWNLGRVTSRGDALTVRQARYAMSLYKQALENGFGD